MTSPLCIRCAKYLSSYAQRGKPPKCRLFHLRLREARPQCQGEHFISVTAERERLRASGLAKLTPEERKALDLR